MSRELRLSKHKKGKSDYLHFAPVQLCCIGSSKDVAVVEVSVDSLQNELNFPLFRAKHDFLASANDMLSFNKGSLFYIINFEEQGMQAIKNMYVPSN